MGCVDRLKHNCFTSCFSVFQTSNQQANGAANLTQGATTEQERETTVTAPREATVDLLSDMAAQVFHAVVFV
jgi:hypothetical protein